MNHRFLDKAGWLRSSATSNAAQTRLFCLPHAGGSASMFRNWQPNLPATTEVIAVQLPGREDRLSTPAIADWQTLLDELMTHIAPLLDRPYMFYGHSLGALIAYWSSLELQDKGCALPAHLFLAACRAPFIAPRQMTHHLTDSAFIEHLRALSLTPQAILADSELMGLLLPTLRADFRLAETAPEHREIISLACPMTILHGTHDTEVPYSAIAAWQELCSYQATLVNYPGDHFFHLENTHDILKLIGKTAYLM